MKVDNLDIKYFLSNCLDYFSKSDSSLLFSFSLLLTDYYYKFKWESQIIKGYEVSSNCLISLNIISLLEIERLDVEVDKWEGE